MCISLFNFWIRRWFRTLPNYFLILTSLVLIWHFTNRPLPNNWPQYFIFSQNFNNHHPSFFGEAWSLAVEEWFYFLAPLSLYAVLKLTKFDKKNVFLVVILTCILLVTAFRIYRSYSYGFENLGSWDLNLRKQVVTRLDSIMYGVLGAYLSIYRNTDWLLYSKWAMILGTILVIFDDIFYIITNSSFYLNYLSLSVTSVGALLLLPFFSNFHCNNVTFVKIITFFSIISYSMYLLNLTPILGFVLPIIMEKISSLSNNIVIINLSFLEYSLYWILTILFSYLIWRYFERPMTSLREKLRLRETR